MVVGDVATAVDLVVLGAGPGGYTAAIRAAQLGQHVVLVDPQPAGGICLREGCIPSKALLTAAERYRQAGRSEQMGLYAEAVRIDVTQMQRWARDIIDRLTGGVQTLLEKNGVEWVQGRGWFLNSGEVRVATDYGAPKFMFEAAIIATGAMPAPLPQRRFDGQQTLTPAQALALERLPEQITIVGADYIAAELATLFGKLEVAVRLLIPKGQHLLDEFDPAAGRLVRRGLKKIGVTVEPKATLSKAVTDASPVVVSLGVQARTADLGLVEAGVRPDERGFIPTNQTMQTNQPHIFAVGDVTGGPALAHFAIKQGKVAAEVLAGLPAAFEPQALPRVAHTDPEVAAVGLTASQAEALGYRVSQARIPLAGNGRALTLDESAGMVQVVAQAETGVMLGATIVGPQAGALIGEVALAIEMGATVTDIAETLHPHPGLGEALLEGAESILGRAINRLS